MAGQYSPSVKVCSGCCCDTEEGVGCRRTVAPLQDRRKMELLRKERRGLKSNVHGTVYRHTNVPKLRGTIFWVTTQAFSKVERSQPGYLGLLQRKPKKNSSGKSQRCTHSSGLATSGSCGGSQSSILVAPTASSQPTDCTVTSDMVRFWKRV